MTKTIIEKSTGKKFTLDELKEFRQEAVDYVDVWRLQAINILIVKLAKKYKLDYYSI